MAKYLCVFALAGLAAAAPLQVVQDQEVVISQIMTSLQPAIDAAIAAALGEKSPAVTSFYVEETVGPVTVSGSLGNSGSYTGSYESFSSNSATSFNSAGVSDVSSASYHDTGYPHTHGGSNNQQQANYGVSVSSIPALPAVPVVTQGANLVSTAGVNGVVYGDVAQQQQQTAQQFTTTAQNVNSAQSVGTVKEVATVSKAARQQQLVSAVMNALAPSVEDAVMRALTAMMQQQQTSSVSSSVSSVSSSTLTASSTEVQTLVTKIISVLTPSITTSVQNALNAKYEAQQAAIAAQQAEYEAQQQLLIQQQQQQAAAQFAAQQQAAQFAAQQQSASSSFSQEELVQQIIVALQPSIATSVTQALEASRLQQQQSLIASQQSSTSSQQSSSSSSSSSGLSSSSLTSIFGDGGAHNVKVDTPQYSFEYNTRK